MNYVGICENPKQFLALTSLYVAEFEILLEHFSPICEKYFRYHTLEGKKRKQPCYKERANAKLQGSEQKLFFLLVYLKTNNLQEFQAASFGISQSKVSQMVAILMNLFNETLTKMGLMPLRDGELLASKLATHPDKVFSYDGMERGILRNIDEEAQEEEYSGKKKRTK